MNGRYAPSPSGPLHLGNLRTALLAWLFARRSGRGLRLRVEDLDQQRSAGSPAVVAGQLADLAALGLTFDAPVVVQSDRLAVYRDVIAGLGDRVYECYCTRREIAEASQAPHGTLRPYPGTCRELSAAERAAKRAVRPAALRIRTAGAFTVTDVLTGPHTEPLDDFVLCRGDGTPAYNLAVVVDDLAMGVDQVVRGDDLLASAPRQAWLATQLGGRPPEYAHVPLAVNGDGRRLAKRDGAVTLADQRALGRDPADVLGRLAVSCGLAEPGEPVDAGVLLRRFDSARLPREPWVVTD